MCLAVDFVLKDPRQPEDEKKEKPLPHREEMAVVPKPWHQSFMTAFEAIAYNLHNTNPCMMQVLSLWHTSFRCCAVTFKIFIHDDAVIYSNVMIYSIRYIWTRKAFFCWLLDWKLNRVNFLCFMWDLCVCVSAYVHACKWERENKVILTNYRMFSAVCVLLISKNFITVLTPWNWRVLNRHSFATLKLLKNGCWKSECL